MQQKHCNLGGFQKLLQMYYDYYINRGRVVKAFPVSFALLRQPYIKND